MTNPKEQLRQQLAQTLRLNDIKAYCLDFEIDYEELAGDTKSDKLRGLLEVLGTQKRIGGWLVRLRQAFPNVVWPEGDWDALDWRGFAPEKGVRQENADYGGVNINAGAGSTVQADGDIVGGDKTVNNTYIYGNQPTDDEVTRSTPLPGAPKLKQLFGRTAEKEYLLTLCQEIQETECGRLLFLTAAHGYGRHALAEWLTIKAAEYNYTTLETVMRPDEVKSTIDHWNTEALRSNAYNTMTIAIVYEAEGITAQWQIEIERYLKQRLFDRPLLLVLLFNTAEPLSQAQTAEVKDDHAWAKAQLTKELVAELHLGGITADDIEGLTGACELRIVERLLTVSGGNPNAALDQWQKLQYIGVIEQGDGDRWQVANETLWGKNWDDLVGERLRERLEMYEDDAPPYEEAVAWELLKTAAMEGESFTLEVLLEVLAEKFELALDDLVDFVDDYLLPYDEDDDEAPLRNAGDELGNSLVILTTNQEGQASRWVNRYQFAEMDDYESWKRLGLKQPPVTPYQLAEAIAAVYTPHIPLVVETLARLYDQAGEFQRLKEVYTPQTYRQHTAEGLKQAAWASLNTLKEPDATLFDCHRALRTANQYIYTANVTITNLRADARELGEQVWPFVQQVTDQPLLATFMNNLGGLLQTMGDYAGARLYYEEALAIWREVLGERHPDTAMSLNNLGALLQAMGDYEGARPYYEEALAIWREVLGERHPSTATSLNNLGYLLDSMGDYEGARPYYEEALAIRREVLGERHPSTAGSLNNLGGLLQAQRDYEGARPYYEEALGLMREVLGERHPSTAVSLNNLGLLLNNMGDYEGARPYFEEALEISREVLGERRPSTAVSLNNLGLLLNNMGDYEGARPYYEEALGLMREVLGERHPDTAGSLNNLGALLRAMGDYEGARPYFEQAVAIAEEVLGVDHPRTKIVRGNLESLLQQINQS